MFATGLGLGLDRKEGVGGGEGGGGDIDAFHVTAAEYGGLTPADGALYAQTLVGGGATLSVVAISQADYDALAVPSSTTLYLVCDVPAPVALTARADVGALPGSPVSDTLYVRT